MDQALWHRHGELLHTIPANTVDGRINGVDGRLHAISQADAMISSDSRPTGSGEHSVSAPNQEVGNDNEFRFYGQFLKYGMATDLNKDRCTLQ
ncbi:unnamed protein product [Phytophthora fragariaefolia]|uniref:Unnamed protein product n=1 Tax=Phytophthora fragariaefolia TaxID=1490495 RepID=A0A9W6YDB5_9STRA|nr:unnamed protein product [Phytophthora fragariaefolia]